MKILLIGLLTFGSISAFAADKCEKIDNKRVELADKSIALLISIKKNDTKKKVYLSFIQILNDDQSLREVEGHTRENLATLIEKNAISESLLLEDMKSNQELLKQLNKAFKDNCL